jgi:radical SAM protein with 4Fe4S-binding SPASM domain
MMPNEALTPTQRAQRYAWEHCVPTDVSLEITLKCNLRCTHCYNFDRSGPVPKSRSGDPLRDDEILRIIDELAAAGTLELGFTGGEALLHPSLELFVSRARKHHFSVKIKSNGLLLTGDRVARLIAAGANDFDISLYGASSAVHDAFTTVPGSHARTLQGIRNVKERGITPRTNIILHRGSVHELGEMIAIASAIGSYSISTDMSARYDGTTSSLDHRITAQQFESLLQGPHGKLFRDAGSNPDHVQCSCARTTAGISSTGELFPCIGAPIPCGNLRDHSFDELWKNAEPLKKIRGLTISDFPNCQPCRLKQHCTRSSGTVFVNTGNYTGLDPADCGLAALREKYSADQLA